MAEWYIYKGGKTHGPLSSVQLKQLAAQSKIDPSTQIRMGADGQWTTADHVRGLFAAAPVATTASGPPPIPAQRPKQQPIPPQRSNVQSVKTQAAHANVIPGVRFTPTAQPARIAAPAAAPSRTDSRTGEEELLKVHPSMFRNEPLKFCFWFFMAFMLFVAPIAMPAPHHGNSVASKVVMFLISLALVLLIAFYYLIWWLRYQRISLTVTNKRTTLRYGLLSRYEKEVRHSDVRMLIVSQGFLQRMLGVGTVAVSCAATSETDIKVGGIPHPDKVKALIDNLRS